ncbi:syntaxin-8 isoform X2 [Centruroides vittatus]|uniref:syntaxin-8 isoform X2 n=1 Tax=Centruroides vittatus TaxID=120091 RepID=UPI0035107EB6
MFQTGDNWISDYSICEAEARDITEKIVLCNQQNRNSSKHVQLTGKIRQLMKKFTDHISTLNESLRQASNSNLITQREVERRQRMLESLICKEKQMGISFAEQISGSGRQHDRVALLGPDYGGPSVVSWEPEESEETKSLTVDEIRQQQQRVIQEQDQGLESLYNVVVRQKKMAQGIGQELDYQNDIIEDIIDHTDRTNESLIRERRHTEVVSRTSGVCF